MPFLDAPIEHISTYHKNAEIQFFTDSQGSLFVTIDTERLHIRSIESTEEDADRVISLFGDEKVMEKYHNGLPIPAEVTRIRIAKWLERWQSNNPYSALAVFGTESQEFLGLVVLGLNAAPGESQLSYLFHPRYWNQGYGTEAVSSLIGYAEATLEDGYTLGGKPLEKIVATARVDNPASFRILEKLGMKRVSTEDKFGAPRHNYILDLKSKEEVEQLMYDTVVKREKRFVIGIPIRTSNENGQFLRDVPPLWDQFYRENLAEKIPNKVNQNLLAVYTDYEGDYTKPFTYLIGCEVANLNTVPEGMRGIELEPSSYAVFIAKGAFPQSMMQTWQSIWTSNVKRSYTTDFEVYRPDFNPHGNPEIRIFIAMAK